MGKLIDLTGNKYGRLTVLKYAGKDKWGGLKWLCKCDCGNKKVVKGSSLKMGLTKSCGCFKKENSRFYGKMNKQHIKFEFNNNICIGITNKGLRFYTDKDDYEKIKDYCWYLGNDGYISTTIYPGKIRLSLHRFITNCPDNMVVDHINHNTLDNRKINLRIVTQLENMKNLSKYKNNKSGFTGVYYYKLTNKWTAKIRANKKLINIGCFNTIEDAIKARKDAELKYFNVGGNCTNENK